MSINGAFRFHSVGQGLFYSGVLNNADSRRKRTFSFVYDCGSISAKKFLYREIDDFKSLLLHARSRSKRRLDLLVISHLHDDHINGLEYLLDNLEVDTVVMPYMDQATLLLARAESSADDAFLRSFYIDPVDWLSSRAVGKIMLVGSRPNDFSGENFLHFNNEQESLYVPREYVLSTSEVQNTMLVDLKSSATAWSYPFQWKFCFRNLELPQVTRYREVLEDFQQEKMLSLDDIFHSGSLTKELAGRLRLILPNDKTVNRTSVVMTHEPILNEKDRTIFWSSGGTSMYGHSFPVPYRCECGYYADKITRHCCRTVLTGDIEVHDEDELEHLWEHNSHFGIIQYPHHGSKGALPNDCIPHEWLSVFSAGLSNQYGHPHPSVLAKQCCVATVDERVAFDYRVTVNSGSKS